MIEGFKSIDGISEGEGELLEAVGISNEKHLANSNPDQLHSELLNANQMLQLVDQTPDIHQVRAWVASSRGEEYSEESYQEPVAHVSTLENHAEQADSVVTVDGPVNFESDPKILKMLESAPVALPVSNKLLADRGISPGDVQVATLLNQATGDIEVSIAARPDKTAEPTEAKPRRIAAREQSLVQSSKAKSTRVEIDKSRVRKLEEFQEVNTDTETKREKTPQHEQTKLIRSARESTNKGRDPKSKRYIRGVLHNRPVLVWMSCLIAVTFLIMIPIGFSSAVLLMLGQSKPETFSWVPGWLVALPIALLVLGLFYILICPNAKCRVCGQKVLLPRHCRKSPKAHHIPIIGYIIPLALHTLTFLWFRCTFCGTSLRIKE